MARQQSAKRREDLLPVIQELRSSGAVSLRDIAEGLNGAGQTTIARGSWIATQVTRIDEQQFLVLDDDRGCSTGNALRRPNDIAES
jgi:hypothetical protein